MANKLSTTDDSLYVRLTNAGQFILCGRLFFTVGGKLQKLCTGSIYYGESNTLNLPDNAKELAFRIDAYKCRYSKMVYNGSVFDPDPTCLLVYGTICNPTLLRVYCSLDGLDSMPVSCNPCS